MRNKPRHTPGPLLIPHLLLSEPHSLSALPGTSAEGTKRVTYTSHTARPLPYPGEPQSHHQVPRELVDIHPLLYSPPSLVVFLF